MKFLAPFAPHVHWLMRLSLAATFLLHGYIKFPIEAAVQMMQMPAPAVLVIAVSEFVAGVALIVGVFTKDWLTRLGGLIVVVIMIGAIVLVHGQNGWNSMNGGMEFQALMLAVGLYFLVRGNEV